MLVKLLDTLGFEIVRKGRVRELLEANQREVETRRDLRWRYDQIAKDHEKMFAYAVELQLDVIENAFNAGILKDNKWMTGCISDAEWLARELGLSKVQWHDANQMRQQFTALANRLVITRFNDNTL